MRRGLEGMRRGERGIFSGCWSVIIAPSAKSAVRLLCICWEARRTAEGIKEWGGICIIPTQQMHLKLNESV